MYSQLLKVIPVFAVLLYAGNANAVPPAGPLVNAIENQSLIVDVAARCPAGQMSYRRFIYASKRHGRCPPGFYVPGGIGGSRCTRSVWACAPRPNCGSGVC